MKLLCKSYSELKNNIPLFDDCKEILLSVYSVVRLDKGSVECNISEFCIFSTLSLPIEFTCQRAAQTTDYDMTMHIIIRSRGAVEVAISFPAIPTTSVLTYHKYAIKDFRSHCYRSSNH